MSLGRARRPAGEHVGREVGHRPDGRAGCRQVAGLRRVVGAGQPEVGELRPVGRQHDVRRLDVAVNDAPGVEAGQPVGRPR